MTALAAPARFLHIVEALLCAAVADLRIRRGLCEYAGIIQILTLKTGS